MAVNSIWSNEYGEMALHLVIALAGKGEMYEL